MPIMRVRRVIPVVLLLLCVDGTAGAADGAAIGLKPGAGGLQLKLQPSFIRMPPDNKDPLPLFVNADNIQGHQDQEIEAEGAVRLRRRGQAIYTDWLRYDKSDNEVTARGNVRLEQRGDALEGTEMRLNLDSERGAIEKPKYQVQVNATSGRGQGDRIVLEGQGKYRVLGASYTSCDVGNDDWFVRAKELEIDKERQIGTARDASVVFLGAPILYSPYLNFSLDRQRKSGFLSPTFGNTGNSGYEVSLPYYWNIAPNRDATITPRVMSKRGEMLNTEFRYLDSRYVGEARYEILPTDHVKNDTSRFALTLRHDQRWDNGWNGNLSIQKVSDDRYFTDLSTQIATTSQTILPRQGSLAKSGTWWNGGTWNASALVQRWQTLQSDLVNPLTPPYNRSQLALTAVKQNAGPADFELYSSAAEFTHPQLANGRRVVAYPSLSLPLQTPFAYLTPKVGVHFTRYDFNQTTTTAPDQNRSVPIFSTESGLVFERGAALFGHSLLQTLEPKIYYVFIPTRSQNQIPNFDSAQQDINFATLYAENQFSGNDRINDANQVTMGVTSRLLHQDTGIERLRISLAQRYYLKTQDVTLPGIGARGSNSSDMLAALSGTVAPSWIADVGWQYATDLSHTQRFNAGTRFQPEPGKVFNLSYRFANTALSTPTPQQNPLAAPVSQAQNTLRQVDLSGQWPLTGRMSAIARWNYSVRDSKLLEGLAGLEYNGGCWAFRIVGHTFTTAATNQASSIFLQLELNGLSKIGSNPLDLLRRNIAGYSRIETPSSRPGEPLPGR